MNHYKKGIFILLMIFTAKVFISCCNCEETKFDLYSNCSINLNNLDYSGEALVLSTNNIISKEAFGMRITITRQESMCHQYKQTSLISSAYAFTCACPPAITYEPLDSIVSIGVLTLTDFDENHHSNDSITDFFAVLQQYEYVSINEYLRNYDHSIDIDARLNNSFTSSISLDLMLMNPPLVSSEYQFKVMIELSDGRVLEETTSMFELI